MSSDNADSVKCPVCSVDAVNEAPDTSPWWHCGTHGAFRLNDDGGAWFSTIPVPMPILHEPVATQEVVAAGIGLAYDITCACGWSTGPLPMMLAGPYLAAHIVNETVLPILDALRGTDGR